MGQTDRTGSRHEGEKRATFSLPEMSIAVQRGNVASILVPCPKKNLSRRFSYSLQDPEGPATTNPQDVVMYFYIIFYYIFV